MDEPSRRSLLRASVPLVGALAGCHVPGSVTDGSNPSDSPIPAPIDLSPEGTVLDQATDTSPVRIELRVTNERDSAVFPLPRTDATVLDVAPHAAGSTGELVCYPPDDAAVTTTPRLATRPVDGCWRLETADGERVRVAVDAVGRATTRFAPGETDSVGYEVYYDGPDDACFPQGTYEMAMTLRFGRETGQFPGDGELASVELDYEFDVAADGDLSLEAVDAPA